MIDYRDNLRKFWEGYGEIIELSGNKMPEWMNGIIPISLFFVWFICNGIVCKNMVDYENRNNEYFIGFRKAKEYFFRFFHLFYFPLSIYWLQKDINKYDETFDHQ